MKLRLKVVPHDEPEADGIWITRKVPHHQLPIHLLVRSDHRGFAISMWRMWFAPIRLKGVKHEIVACRSNPRRLRKP